MSLVSGGREIPGAWRRIRCGDIPTPVLGKDPPPGSPCSPSTRLTRLDRAGPGPVGRGDEPAPALVRGALPKGSGRARGDGVRVGPVRRPRRRPSAKRRGDGATLRPRECRGRGAGRQRAGTRSTTGGAGSPPREPLNVPGCLAVESDSTGWGDRFLQRIVGEPAPPVARQDKVIERLRSDPPRSTAPVCTVRASAGGAPPTLRATPVTEVGTVRGQGGRVAAPGDHRVFPAGRGVRGTCRQGRGERAAGAPTHGAR